MAYSTTSASEVENLDALHVKIIGLLASIHSFEYSLVRLPDDANNKEDLIKRAEALKQLTQDEINSKFINTFEPFKDIIFGLPELEHLAVKGYIVLHPSCTQSLSSVLFPSKALQYSSLPVELGRKMIKFWYEHLLHTAELTPKGREIAAIQTSLPY